MKRLIVCCDGTWQDLKAGYPTNVVKITQTIKNFDDKGIQQVVYYDEGIGAESNISPEEDLTFLGAGHREQFLENIKGGAFGKGIDKNIRDAYSFLCLNYTPGDEIYLFGFSRGAYTVRSLAGMLYYCGLIKRPHLRRTPEAYELYRTKLPPHHPELAQFRQDYCYQTESKYSDRVPIKLLGCWDTVGSLGLPDALPHLPINKLINRDRYKFHDTTLSPIVENAVHAVAIDETRKAFAVTLMEKSPEAEQTLKQIWFPGDHGCVGGGTAPQSKLADSALLWMMQEVEKLGLDLKFDSAEIPETEKIDPDPTYSYEVEPRSKVLSKLSGGRLTGNIRGDLTKVGTYVRPIPVKDEIHPTAFERWRKRDDYRPSNLDPQRVPSKS